MTSINRDTLLDAALDHVPFDGWSEATLRAAAAECSVSPETMRAHFPRGAVDLALAYHARGDAAMEARLAEADLSALRFREKVTAAVRFRLEAIDTPEAVRRGMTLFALPMHAADGVAAVWGTADKIWTALGDTSDDVNWYTKRMTLAGVYGATVLYWLGDTSPDKSATWAFLDRRIEDVMQFEKLKASVRENPVLKPLMAGPDWLFSLVKKPTTATPRDLPDVFSSVRGGRP